MYLGTEGREASTMISSKAESSSFENLGKSLSCFFLLLGIGKTILEQFKYVEGVISISGAWFFYGRSQLQLESIFTIDNNKKKKFLRKATI